jgi:hypothetical protein
MINSNANPMLQNALKQMHIVADYVNYHLETLAPNAPYFNIVMQHIGWLLTLQYVEYTPITEAMEKSIFSLLSRMLSSQDDPNVPAKTLYLFGLLILWKKITKDSFVKYLLDYVRLYHQCESLLNLHGDDYQLIIRCLVGMERIANAIDFLDLLRDAGVMETTMKLIGRLMRDVSHSNYHTIVEIVPFIPLLAEKDVYKADQLLLWWIKHCYQSPHFRVMSKELEKTLSAMNNDLLRNMINHPLIAEINALNISFGN